MSLRENFNEVNLKIEEACIRSGRKREDVTLIAVSKTKPLSMITEMAAFPQSDFGENHVQEIIEKYDAFPDVTYHMIGHLQRNKVKQVIKRVKMIHSVDSFRLAEEISKEAVKADLCMDILIEINVGNEETKYGFSFEEVSDEIEKIATLPGIRVKGLMCVAPFVENAEENRPLFRKMHDLLVDIRNKNIDNVDMSELSMGMTNDYEIAIEEGATLVRVGTALFGERKYPGGKTNE